MRFDADQRVPLLRPTYVRGPLIHCQFVYLDLVAYQYCRLDGPVVHPDLVARSCDIRVSVDCPTLFDLEARPAHHDKEKVPSHWSVLRGIPLCLDYP